MIIAWENVLLEMKFSVHLKHLGMIFLLELQVPEPKEHSGQCNR